MLIYCETSCRLEGIYKHGVRRHNSVNRGSCCRVWAQNIAGHFVDTCNSFNLSLCWPPLPPARLFSLHKHPRLIAATVPVHLAQDNKLNLHNFVWGSQSTWGRTQILLCFISPLHILRLLAPAFHTRIRSLPCFISSFISVPLLPIIGSEFE